MTLVHVHTHTEFSSLDGLQNCGEAVQRAVDDGNPALAITDHGYCTGHPEHQRACDAAGIKPLFGMESYFVPDRTERAESGDTEAQKRLRANKHMVLLAQNSRGLRDLWALSTEAFVSGFYYKPRCDWELLEQYGSRLIVTTACLGGVISRLCLDRDYDAVGGFLRRLDSIFHGRLYLEIQPNRIPDQMLLNKLLVAVSEHTGIPLVAAADSHYPSKDEHSLHKTWMALQTSPTSEDYWQIDPMWTEAEMRVRLGYLDPQAVDEAIRNTVLIGEQCNARIEGHAEPPVFLRTHEEDSRVLLDRCVARIDHIPHRGGTLREYEDRLTDEWQLVASKQLAGCYLMVDDICTWARSENILVGPGRGSAAGSLMSYLLGVTVPDPLETGLLFSRFLTPGRTALPDFDLDFPSSQRDKVQGRMAHKYGAANVVRVGTNMRYRSKSILNKLFVLNSDQLPDDCFPDSREIAAIIDEAESHTAGLGMPWPELMETMGDQLAPFIERYTWIFNTAGRLVNRLHSYGKHPAGLVVSTGVPLEGTLPMRTASATDPTLVSQWDFRDVESGGLLKLDFLTLRTLDTIQLTLDMIERRTGTRPDPAAWRAEYEDPQVWDEIGSGHTLGMFQVETTLGQQFSRRMKPRSLAELADLIALVRPGPRNSGLAESYMRRRAGKEDVSYPHPLLAESLEVRFGTMIYQEDILRACTALANYDGAEADAVRKVLGKKLTEKVDEAGVMFTDRCEANGVPRAEAEALWAQMAEFGRYAFNLAHAYSYALLAYWTGWLKTHYPVEELASICSTVDEKDRIAAFVTEARRLGVSVLPPDVNRHTAGFAPEGTSIRYGLDAIKGVGDAALLKLTVNHPFSSWQDFAARSGVNAGIVYALARAGALDGLVASRRALVSFLDSDRAGDLIRCVFKDESHSGPGGLPCHYDWASEPVPIRISAKTGKELKSLVRSLPVKCTRACRNYTAPDPVEMDAGLTYAPTELWHLENEIYGTWLTPLLFEQLDKITDGGRALAGEIAASWDGLPPGSYLLPGVVARRQVAHTRTGSQMVWLTLATESSYIDIAVFGVRDENDPDLLTAMRFLTEGTLVLATAERSWYRAKTGRRMSNRLQAIRRLG
jgi:DNA polymerase-3 subunit alpha